jgi:opacity protein-like surface antigen
MKSIVGLIAVVVVMVSSGVASAQTRAPASGQDKDRGYIEGVAQSAFGNVTSQSYGVEFGYTIRRDLQVFGEVGRIRDVADSTFSGDAATIATALSQVQPAAVAVTAKRPVTFFGGGIKYRPPSTLAVQPYVMGGFGFGNVDNDVTFTLGGAVASASTLAQYVTLGSDLSGSSTNAMLTLGGGAMVPLWRTLLLDLQYRYGRIFSDEGINTNRAGVGFGVRF